MVGPTRTTSSISTARQLEAAAPANATHIPRPPNPWILYRAEKIQQGYSLTSISLMWENKSAYEHQQYKDLAQLKKAEHKLKYPNYRYQPKTKEQKKILKEQKELEKSLAKQGNSSNPQGDLLPLVPAMQVIQWQSAPLPLVQQTDYFAGIIPLAAPQAVGSQVALPYPIVPNVSQHSSPSRIYNYDLDESPINGDDTLPAEDFNKLVDDIDTTGVTQEHWSALALALDSLSCESAAPSPSVYDGDSIAIASSDEETSYSGSSALGMSPPSTAPSSPADDIVYPDFNGPNPPCAPTSLIFASQYDYDCD